MHSDVLPPQSPRGVEAERKRYAAAVQIFVLVHGENGVHSGELAAARRLFLALLADLDRTFHSVIPDAKKVKNCFLHHASKLVSDQAKGHIAGDRYTLTDSAAALPLCTSTPASKLAASKSLTAQAVAAQLWSDVQDHMAVAPGRRSGDADVPPPPPLPPPPRAPSSGLGATGSHLSAAARSSSQGDDSGDNRAASTDAARRASSPSPPPPPPSSRARKADVKRTAAGGGGGRQRLEVAALTPDKRWVAARWAMGAELLHVDDAATGDSAALAAAWKNANSLLDNHFPGVMGI